MSTRLLTQQDLADRWQVSVRTIEDWRKAGLIQSAKGVPAIRFSPEHIAALEGVEIKPVSPLRVRTLEREVESLQHENERLRGVLARILSEAALAAAE